MVQHSGQRFSGSSAAETNVWPIDFKLVFFLPPHTRPQRVGAAHPVPPRPEESIQNKLLFAHIKHV
jgi:hypothetical protein